MKKKLILIWLLVISIVFTSCKGYKDINSLAIILGISVDKLSNGELIMGSQTAKTSEAIETQKSSYVIETGVGNSVFDAAGNIDIDTDSENYWPHVQTIIIGRSFAEDGIIPLLDFFTRDSQRRRLVKIVVAKEQGLSMLQNIAKVDLNTSTELDTINNNVVRSGYGVDSSINQFLKDSSGVSGVGALNKFISTKSRRFTKSDKHLAPESLLDGIAIFYKYKMINSLDKRDTRAFNMLRDNIDNFSVVLSFKDTDLTYSINGFKTKFDPVIEDGKYIMKVNMFVNTNIVEANGKLNLKDGVLNLINDELENYIYDECMRVFDISKKEIELDIFDFGTRFSRKKPEILEFGQDKWNKIFVDNVDIKISVFVNNEYRGNTVELLKE